MRWLRQVAVLVGAVVVPSGIATAHAVGGTRFEAPLPLALLYAGAGATVLVTAGWLAGSPRALERFPARRRLGAIPPGVGRAARTLARGAFLLAFVVVVLAGLVGPRAPAANLATVFVWPVWFKGLAVVAAVAGSPWRALSPWRTLYDGLRAIEGREIAVLGGYPRRLGAWPALLGFVVLVGLLENLTGLPRSPSGTTLVVAAYAGVMLLGGVAFGEAWFRRADPLGVLYRLFGRVAPIAIERDPSGGYVVSVRSPWSGCTRPVGDPALVGFVVATVYTVSFDGFAGTPAYRTVRLALREAVGLGPSTGMLVYGLGFAIWMGAFAAVVGLAEVAGGGTDPRGALAAFAPTVLPIAVAYEVAHNYPYVAANAGQLPVVLGRYVVAEPAAIEPLAWLSIPAFWASQVLLIVAGHVVAVVAAHLVAVGRYRSRGRAVRAHVPPTGLMVAYTVLSLWIVSRPVAA